jgi:hypothetical protein
MKMNEEQIKAANHTNAYGGGGSFGWAPNLLATAHKDDDSKQQTLKKGTKQRANKKKVGIKATNPVDTKE